MTWFQQSANETEAAKTRYLPFIAVDFDFPSAHSRMWTGIGTITINGNTYMGIGDLGGITSPPEHSRLVDEAKVYSLSGYDPSLVLEADIDGSFNRSVTEYLGFANPDTLESVATPDIYWEGSMGSIQRVDGPEPVVTVSATHILAIMHYADGYRYTHEHQQEFFAGDLFFREAATTETKEVIWQGGAVRPGGVLGLPYYGQTGGLSPLNREH